MQYENRMAYWHSESIRIANILRGFEKRLRMPLMPSIDRPSSLRSLSPELDMDDEDFLGEKTSIDAQNEKVQLQTLGFRHPASKLAKVYPAVPRSVGLTVQHIKGFSSEWNPPWDVFPLKVFRGSSYTYVKINAHWDDADLLRDLRKSYDSLRTVWRKWFSLRNVRYVRFTSMYGTTLTASAGLLPWSWYVPIRRKDRHSVVLIAFHRRLITQSCTRNVLVPLASAPRRTCDCATSSITQIQ